MHRPRNAICFAASLLLMAGAALADEGRPLRLVGEAPSLGDQAPKRFIIDAVVTPGDAPFKSEVSGWLAALPPDIGSGEVTGSCVEDACAISADLDGGDLALTGPLIAKAGPITGKAKLGDDGPTGEARFTILAGTTTELGELAGPGAIGAAELRDLLAWNGSPTGFSNAEGDGPPGDMEREALAMWQQSMGKPMTGLILVADLQALREAAKAEKAKAGWTPLGDAAHGWSGGYPAAILPQAARSGAEQSFTSADGKARLVVAIEPARSDEAFDAIVEEETADHAGREDVGYTRVNGDMEVSYTEKGVRTVKVWHARHDGMARLAYSFPAGDEAYGKYETILARSLKVTDALKGQ
jgi:hypothetical protein